MKKKAIQVKTLTRLLTVKSRTPAITRFRQKMKIVYNDMCNLCISINGFKSDEML